MNAALARRAASALLNVVLFGTFVAVPLLDGVATEYDAVIESEHGSCDYVRIHDHAICVQFGSNTAAPAPAPVALRSIPHVDDPADRGDRESQPDGAAVLQERSRGPPLI